MDQTTATEHEDLLATLRKPFLFGRWILFVSQVVESILFVLWRSYAPASDAAGQPPSLASILALSVLTVYNIVTLVIVRRVPLPRLNVTALLALDFVVLGVAAYFTSASRSPLLGEFYILIFIAALFHDVVGGVLAGLAAAVITALLAYLSPIGWGQVIRNLIPYFLITGAYTGYLVRVIRIWYSRYGTALKQEREREIQEGVRRHEMDLATRIQRAALPIAHPKVPHLDIATVSEFSLDVGGDFYLFLPQRHRLIVVVGDVSGKGIGAALTATSISHLLPWLHPLDDPAKTFSDLNKDLLDRLPADVFVTLVLAEIDTEKETVHVWSAGHPPAFLWCAASGKVIPSMAEGSLLGILPEWDGKPWTADFRPGDALLLYTDGLTEARRGRHDLFGEERAARALRRNAGRSAQGVAQSIAGAAKSWGSVSDDLTIVVCQRPAGHGGKPRG